jgi:hypothetical protein
MQSIKEKDFECLAKTGVNALGTMFPDSGAVARKLGFRSAEKHPNSQYFKESSHAEEDTVCDCSNIRVGTFRCPDYGGS